MYDFDCVEKVQRSLDQFDLVLQALLFLARAPFDPVLAIRCKPLAWQSRQACCSFTLFSALHQFLFQMKDFCTLSAYCLMHSNGRYCEYYYAAQTVYWRKFMFIVCTFKISKGEELELWSTQKPSPMYYPVRSQMWAEYVSCEGGGRGRTICHHWVSRARCLCITSLCGKLSSSAIWEIFFQSCQLSWNLISVTVINFAIVTEFA